MPALLGPVNDLSRDRAYGGLRPCGAEILLVLLPGTLREMDNDDGELRIVFQGPGGGFSKEPVLCQDACKTGAGGRRDEISIV